MTLVRPVLNGAINLLGAAGFVSLAQAGYKAAGGPFFAEESKQQNTLKNYAPKAVYGFLQVFETSKTTLATDLVKQGCTYLALNIFAQTILMKKFPWNVQDLKILNFTHLAKRTADVAILFFKSTSLIRLAQGIYQLLEERIPVSLEKKIGQNFPILKPLHSKSLIIEGVARTFLAEFISYCLGYDSIPLKGFDSISLNSAGLAILAFGFLKISERKFWPDAPK